MQRFTARVENLGGRLAAAIFDLLAIYFSNREPRGTRFRDACPLGGCYSIVRTPLRSGIIVFLVFFQRTSHGPQKLAGIVVVFSRCD